jgi:hypothetical protein
MLVNLAIGYVVLSLVYFFVRSRSNRAQALTELWIALLIPGFGLIFLLLVGSAKILRLTGEDPSYMYRDFKIPHTNLGNFTREEADIIPIQDVLTLDDTKTKRALLGDVIKKDVLINKNVLYKAVKDPDSEVSHYAVSVVTQKIEEMETILFQLEKRLDSDSANIEVLKQYVEVMEIYVKMGFLDEVSQRKSEEAYVYALEKLLALDASEKRYFIEKIDFELKLGHFKKAENYCGLFMSSFPGDEDPYVMYIKLYHRMNNYQKLQEKIRQLKGSDIRFTNKALETIRFWDGGEQVV